MEHSEKYLQAKWVTENPKGYDERDVARANSYCEAYLEGYNQALSIANVRQGFFTSDSFEVRFNCEHCDTPYSIVRIDEGEVVDKKRVECDCEYNAGLRKYNVKGVYGC